MLSLPFEAATQPGAGPRHRVAEAEVVALDGADGGAGRGDRQLGVGDARCRDRDLRVLERIVGARRAHGPRGAVEEDPAHRVGAQLEDAARPGRVGRREGDEVGPRRLARARHHEVHADLVVAGVVDRVEEGDRVGGADRARARGRPEHAHVAGEARAEGLVLVHHLGPVGQGVEVDRRGRGPAGSADPEGGPPSRAREPSPHPAPPFPSRIGASGPAPQGPAVASPGGRRAASSARTLRSKRHGG
jgi:hypothetical protein